MKSILFSAVLLFAAVIASAQGILRLDDKGLGIPQFATNPVTTAADKGKVIFNTTLNKLLYCDGTTWVEAGAGSATTNWNNIGTGAYLLNGYVAIGKSTPNYPLDILSTGAFPSIKIKSTSGPAGIDIDANTGDAGLRLSNNGTLQWSVRNEPATNNFQIFELGSGGSRLIVQNGTGNLGIGTALPSEKLDVAGNAAISGNLTVEGGKGIVRNADSDQLKVWLGEYTVVANLGAHARSSEFTMNFSGVSFTQPPTIVVGDETVLSYVSGEAYRVIVKVYDCTATSCKGRMINTSPNSVNYSFKYKVVATGH